MVDWIVPHGILERKPNVARELFVVLIQHCLQVLLHRAQVHRVLDDVEVIQALEAHRVNLLIEDAPIHAVVGHSLQQGLRVDANVSYDSNSTAMEENTDHEVLHPCCSSQGLEVAANLCRLGAVEGRQYLRWLWEVGREYGSWLLLLHHASAVAIIHGVPR